MSLADAYRDLEARLAKPPDEVEHDGKPWKPWTNDDDSRTLIGRLAGVMELPENDGMPACTLAIIVPRDGGEPRSLVIRHTALVRRWEQQAPTVGDLVGLHYRGRDVTKAGREYHAWRLEVVRSKGEPEPTPQLQLPADDTPVTEPTPRHAIYDDDDSIPF